MMKWISVKEKGLPEPAPTKQYLVLLDDGTIGHGSYHHSFQWNPDMKSFERTDKIRWFLDFDGIGHEDQILYYMEIEYPKEWDEQIRIAY